MRKLILHGRMRALVLFLHTLLSGWVSVREASAQEFLFQWGSFGTGDGQFNLPMGIAVDSLGNVYVADTDNSRIQKFDSNGVFLTKWGSSGSGDGKFLLPRDVALDSAGNVYVADTLNSRIQKFDSNGVFLTKWGSSGSGDGQFANAPRGVALDSFDDVYAVDVGVPPNPRIQRFTSAGAFLTKWGSLGTGDGQFAFISDLVGIAVDSFDNVYVVDSSNSRIQKFDSNGVFLTKWGSSGSGDGQFGLAPMGIAFDPLGNVYLADRGNERIQKFTSDGTFLTTFGSFGSGDGQFNCPRGVASDSLGNIYVTDTLNHRVQVFAPDEIQLLLTLADTVADLNLQQGIDNNLDSKLAAIQQALDDINTNNDVAAINALQSFINAVEAQRGKEISDADADLLIAQAQAIIDLLSQ